MQRRPRVHLVLDLDETLISGPTHRQLAAFAGIRALTEKGLKITNPEMLRLFNVWNYGGRGEEQREGLSSATGYGVSLHEAFLFDYATRNYYDRNPNDLKQYDKLIAAASPKLGILARKKLVKAAVSAYHDQRDENARTGVLAALPYAPELLDWAASNKLNIVIASKGYRERQRWKVEHLLVPKTVSKVKPKLYTTDRRFLWWKFSPKDKKSNFYKSVFSKIKVRKGDLKIHVGDRHDTDVVEAKKAGFDFIVHVPGRRDRAYLTGEKQSQADVVARDLNEAMDKTTERIHAFYGKEK